MAGHNALVRKFKQFNGSPPARTRGHSDDRERSVELFAEVQKIYRECSPAAANEMCRLALEAEDERVRSKLRLSKSAPQLRTKSMLSDIKSEQSARVVRPFLYPAPVRACLHALLQYRGARPVLEGMNVLRQYPHRRFFCEAGTFARVRARGMTKLPLRSAWDYYPAGLPGRTNYSCSPRRSGTILLPASLTGARRTACLTASARAAGSYGFLITGSTSSSSTTPNSSA
jgi:hypothetical protein